jgi:hypothetical protein
MDSVDVHGTAFLAFLSINYNESTGISHLALLNGSRKTKH